MWKKILKWKNKLLALKTWTFFADYKWEKYGLDIEILLDQKIVKFYARNLKRKDIISGNFYKIWEEYIFRPCEISQSYALDFIENMNLTPK